MALAATCIHEVQTGGNDTSNSGIFDPGQTAGMFTDGAATSANTSAPVFSSASYNFVAGDVGAWVFIGAGTNWIPGWYLIASVASNNATLTGAIGAAVVSLNVNAPTLTTCQLGPSTVVGCATVASPTGATWSIDYSQQAAPKFTYTDLTSVGAGLLVSSVANPFAKEQVGNSLVITSGTNFTAGRYVIASVAAGVATVQGAANITTGAGVSGVGSQGGAYASPGKPGAHMVAVNVLYVKTATYTVTSASTNIAAGCFAVAGNSTLTEGYATVRGDLSPVGAAGTRPTIIASGISTFTLLAPTGLAAMVRNFILDGASLTSSRGVSSANLTVVNVHAQNCTNGGLGSSSMHLCRCSATGCSTVAAIASTGIAVFCVAYNNTFTGFLTSQSFFCLSYGNSGATSDGFGNTTTTGAVWANCTAYGNGRDGFRPGANNQHVVNCIAEGNTGVGINSQSGATSVQLCATYLNTGGATAAVGTRPNYQNLIAGSGSFFVNAAGGNFALNNTAGAGAALRAAGYPGVFPAGLTTGYLDIGAVQHQDAGGGGAPIIGGSIVRAA